MQFRFRDPVMSVNVGVIKLCRLEKDKLLIVKKNGYPEFEDVRQGCKKLCKKKPPPIYLVKIVFSLGSMKPYLVCTFTSVRAPLIPCASSQLNHIVPGYLGNTQKVYDNTQN